MTFLSSTANNKGQPIALIKYFLDDNSLMKSENTGSVTLNETISDFGSATVTGILGFNVSALQFKYFDNNKEEIWQNRWSSKVKHNLPDAIEVKMTISDMLERYTETFTNVISIH